MREKWSKMLAKLPYHALLDRAVRHVLVAAVAIGGQRGGDMVAHPEQLPKKDRAVGAHVLKTGISIGTGLHTPISVRLRWAPSSDAEPPQKKSLAVQDFWLDIAGRSQVTRALSPETRGPATQTRSIPRSLSLR